MVCWYGEELSQDAAEYSGSLVTTKKVAASYLSSRLKLILVKLGRKQSVSHTAKIYP